MGKVREVEMMDAHIHTQFFFLAPRLFTTLLDPVTFMLHLRKLQRSSASRPTCVTLAHPDKSSVLNELQWLTNWSGMWVTFFHPDKLRRLFSDLQA